MIVAQALFVQSLATFLLNPERFNEEQGGAEQLGSEDTEAVRGELPGAPKVPLKTTP